MNGKDKFLKTIQIVVIIALIEIVSQIVLKKGSIFSHFNYVIYGMIGYCIIGYLLSTNFSFDGIGQVNLIWNCMSTILAFTFGYLIFKEPINRYTYYSIVFALAAIYFSYLSDIKDI